MGLFRRDPPEPAPPPLPIPRVSRVWPKAQPKAAVSYAAPPEPAAAPPAVESPKPSVRDAASVVAAFSTWKQATAARTASATAVADASSLVVTPKAEDSAPSTPAAGLPRTSVPLMAPPPPPLLQLGDAPPALRRPEPPPVVRPEEPTPPPIAARREDPVMYVYRAAAKQARGEHEAAIADLSRAIELDPACTVALAGRAMSLEALGDLAGAKRDYAKSIEIELRQEIARLARPL